MEDWDVAALFLRLRTRKGEGGRMDDWDRIERVISAGQNAGEGNANMPSVRARRHKERHDEELADGQGDGDGLGACKEWKFCQEVMT